MKKLFKLLKWVFMVILIVMIGIVLLDFVPRTFSEVKGTNTFIKEGEYPLVIPHGGAKRLAPENTAYAYTMLMEDFEADVLEIDLALTKDNVLMAHHNLDLEFSAGSKLNGKLIKDYTYQEILTEYENDDYYLARQFSYPSDYKEGIQPFKDESDPEVLKTLIPADLKKDIFEKYGDSVLYMLEIKDSPKSINYEQGSDRYKLAAQTLIDMVYEYGLEHRVVLASFADEVTAYFKEHAPEILIGAGTSEVTNFSIYSAFHVDFFWQVQSEVLILPNQTSMQPISGSTAKLLDYIPGFIRDNMALKGEGGYHPNLTHKAIINDAHRKNISVIYWTINDPEEMRYLISLGVDGIITDRPDLLIEVIRDLKGN